MQRLAAAAVHALGDLGGVGADGDDAVSAEAKTWTQKFGSNLFSWSADDQTEYARRYKGATLREPRSDEIRFEDLQKNDIVGAIFARVKYFESGAEIPSADNPDAQAAVYKKYYNTAAGRGDAEIFKKKTQKYLRPAAQGGK